MRIPEEEPENEEIINPEQFQVGRAPEEEKPSGEEDSEDIEEDSDYTEDEVEFADGAGTELDEEIDTPDPEDLEDELDEIDEDFEEDEQ
ncbi:hypothetical protein [Pedobacter sp. GR22-6]|uniref:hypothetical protein n=1 Tax=Pedobacter sp. GR22-6 TaxID=3127957 RepID=UPI00307E7FA0